ncbi:MAG: hypothetical protein MZV70_46605 [Desulfobacterales bacterium]|nr:hypothetical protein [Desulfobacterales bacterium]
MPEDLQRVETTLARAFAAANKVRWKFEPRMRTRPVEVHPPWAVTLGRPGFQPGADRHQYPGAKRRPESQPTRRTV